MSTTARYSTTHRIEVTVTATHTYLVEVHQRKVLGGFDTEGLGLSGPEEYFDMPTELWDHDELSDIEEDEAPELAGKLAVALIRSELENDPAGVGVNANWSMFEVSEVLNDDHEITNVVYEHKGQH